MTANQIEYWKLQESKRHNIVTEEMERPYKESLTKLNQEYILNQPYIRELNSAQARAAYANEAAGYASAALSYEKIATEETQQALNLEKGRTESTIQGYNEARTAGQDISNIQQQYITSQYEYTGLLSTDKLHYLDFNTNTRQKGAKSLVNRDYYYTGGSAANSFTSGMFVAANLFGK